MRTKVNLQVRKASIQSHLNKQKRKKKKNQPDQTNTLILEIGMFRKTYAQENCQWTQLAIAENGSKQVLEGRKKTENPSFQKNFSIVFLRQQSCVGRNVENVNGKYINGQSL